MKSLATFTFLIAASSLAIAQDRMAETLRKGVLEEESSQNLGAAIRAYESVLAQFDEARKTAATALFRLAESYRKQGNTDQAIAAYRRVVREFPDQAPLAEQSRNHLAKTFNLPAEPAAASATMSMSLKPGVEPAEVQKARKEYRGILEAEIKMAEERVQELEKKYQLGVTNRESISKAQQELLEARRELVAFEYWGVVPAPGSPRR